MIISVKFCFEIPQLQYIDLNEIVNDVKVVVILTSVHINVSTFFWLVNFLSAEVSPEERLNLGYGNHKEYPFPPNGDVPWIEVTDTKIYM